MSFCICPPNFVQIGPSATELWRHIYFSRWRPRYRNSTSGFGFRDFSHLRRSKSTGIPNYGITARYLNTRLRYNYFRFLKTNVRHVGTLLPVRIFTFASPSACHSVSACLISSKSDHPRRIYDVISIFQDGGLGIAILLPVSVFVISLISEGRNLSAYQISAIYLNTRLRYYYFQFLKTKVRHVGTLPAKIEFGAF